MKRSELRNLIKEAISDMEVSLKLSNGKIIHGLARKDTKALSLQIGSNTYFSFWEGKFTLSGTGDVTIVEGVDDYSQEWFLKTTEEYLAAMQDAYPEKFKYNTTGPIGMNESTYNMKRSTLRQIIREEVSRVLKEENFNIDAELKQYFKDNPLTADSPVTYYRTAANHVKQKAEEMGKKLTSAEKAKITKKAWEYQEEEFISSHRFLTQNRYKQ